MTMVCWLAVGVAGVVPAGAQIRASERALVAQEVDGTRITVEYGRPQARGRELYGVLEPWGRSWTPGADRATTIEVSKPVTILGMSVPKGRYSVWLQLEEQGPWAFFLDPRDAIGHAAFLKPTSGQYRAPVTPISVPHTEVLTWSFPEVSTSGATLDMRWGTKAVRIPIAVQPTYAMTFSEADVAPYVGVYDFTWTDPANKNPRARFTIAWRDGRLVGLWTPAQFGATETWLLGKEPDRFVRSLVRNGELWSTFDSSVLVFTRSNGRVTGFELRDGDALDGRGVRQDP
jgi:hypothetical protein